MSDKEHNWEAHVEGLNRKIHDLSAIIHVLHSEKKLLESKVKKLSLDNDALQRVLSPMNDEQVRLELKVALKQAARYASKIERLQITLQETSERSQRKVTEVCVLLWRMLDHCRSHKLLHTRVCASKQGYNCNCFFRMVEHYALLPRSVRKDQEKQLGL